MDHPLPARVQKLAAGFVEGPAQTSAETRRAIVALAGRPGGDPGAVPEGLRDYVEKVALEAHRVTDDDIAALKAAGHTEEAIFEVTIGAALGAGLARMERGLAALRRSR
jgi:hypothetical protein